MSSSETPDTPDFSTGIDSGRIPDNGIIAGRVGDDEAVLVRCGDSFHVVGAHCTHYGGPLAEGLVSGTALRCPWHHACFDLASGEALAAPALDPIPCWRVERVGSTLYARERLPAPRPRVIAGPALPPGVVVIVGGGAAGLAAADMLRREGYPGTITMLSADDSPPCDRPNLSKDFLAGNAPDDWIPLRPPEFYADRRIDLVLNARVAALDTKRKEAVLGDGRRYPYGALLVATGADPVHLDVPGAAAGQLMYLRSFSDSKAIIARAATAKHALVVGASFIGLEVAASLRARGIEVHVVGPEKVPLERVLGLDAGQFVRRLHESKGVTFHLGRTVGRLDGDTVTLDDGSTFAADLAVLGVGVRPSLALAEQAGLKLDRGIVVDRYLQTSAPDVFAAGDAVRWPDPHTGDNIRVEHWAVAERHGQIAARNILGQRVACDIVPFFWSQHYDVAINYVGHAERWDAIDVDGSLDARDCAIRYRRGGRTLAVATIGRDILSLREEVAMEQRAAGR
ncbi:MAG: FAD-dependent oxidoreductase [Proteobacteria bacterium]|nr:FAD-dependent oxidoreductase [Pseudomonadota bacterium]